MGEIAARGGHEAVEAAGRAGVLGQVHDPGVGIDRERLVSEPAERLERDRVHHAAGVGRHLEDEAVRLPSEHEYGNGVAIFTRDGDTARDFVNRVQVGMVGVNFAIPVPLAYYTFGGWKRSGFGDLNQHGPDSIRFYTKTKTVTSRWPTGTKEGAEFVIPTMK